MNHYIIYRHRRKDNNKVFYIGCSKSIKRAYDFVRRNDKWLSIYSQTDVVVEIIANNLIKKDALYLERFIIESYEGLSNMYYNGYNVWNKGKKLSKEHISKLKDNSSLCKKVICTETNKVYDSVSSASKATKYSRGHFKNMLNGLRTNKTNFRWA